jgi:hypothetical protein
VANFYPNTSLHLRRLSFWLTFELRFFVRNKCSLFNTKNFIIKKPTWCTFHSVYQELRASTCFEHYSLVFRTSSQNIRNVFACNSWTTIETRWNLLRVHRCWRRCCARVVCRSLNRWLLVALINAQVLAAQQYGIISQNLWPPRSPDLTYHDFFLWGYLKERVYRGNPRTVEALKDNIRPNITHAENYFCSKRWTKCSLVFGCV